MSTSSSIRYLVISQCQCLADYPHLGISEPIIEEPKFKSRVEAAQFIVDNHIEDSSYTEKQIETLGPWLVQQITALQKGEHFESFGEYSADDKESFSQQLLWNATEGDKYHRYWIQEFDIKDFIGNKEDD